MTMVSSGPISLGGNATTGGLNQSVNIELGRAATASINMNESAVRTLAGVASGAISMNNFYGKANQFEFTISTNQTNANLRTLAVNAGWNQSSRVVATINSGVFVSSNSTGTPALVINGSFPGGVELINNGTIAGRGGNGGRGGDWADGCCGPGPGSGVAGSSGGTALSVSVAVSINNGSGIIGGGGGGGGGAASWSPGFFSSFRVGGGGGGGGRSGTTNSSGGAGGYGFSQNGGAGGAGTSSAAGSGGTSGSGNPGGAGGGRGSAGATGGSNSALSGSPGGAGGAAVTGNSNITWIAFGTRQGSIS